MIDIDELKGDIAQLSSLLCEDLNNGVNVNKQTYYKLNLLHLIKDCIEAKNIFNSEQLDNINKHYEYIKNI